MTKTIAITGGIGSGKSTLCSKLKDKGFKIETIGFWFLQVFWFDLKNF